MTSEASAPRNERTSAQRSIALVEDQREIRESWVRLIGSFREFCCVCACASGESALIEIPKARPEVILMDIFLPGMSGIECTARLKELLPGAQILILTAADDDEMVFPALEAGADGYLLKQARPAELREALLDVLHGGVPMTSGIARRVVDYFRERGKTRGEVIRLSPREKEILVMLSKGFSNKEIAEQLTLSVETVHGYLKKVYEKMHVRSRAEAVAKYMSSRVTSTRR
ncbi:MAG TPA: response regulator transcription factor [Verrucomicrobiae bacterium]|nr:response regulator transcription factor [Verrucomicrobiae bacterium]